MPERSDRQLYIDDDGQVREPVREVRRVEVPMAPGMKVAQVRYARWLEGTRVVGMAERVPPAVSDEKWAMITAPYAHLAAGRDEASMPPHVRPCNCYMHRDDLYR